MLSKLQVKQARPAELERESALLRKSPFSQSHSGDTKFEKNLTSPADPLLFDGSQKANDLASKKIKEIKELVGF